ncbi:MAG TPA: hypothetical protein VG713_15485, partial [Pirellulales bacterium]|nr:hypothetical protein [Pirellulales bacterium]
MNRRIIAFAVVAGALAVASLAMAQNVATREAAKIGPPTAPAAQPRKLAPGVEQTIPFEERIDEKVTRQDLTDILAENPTFGVKPGSTAPSPAKGVRFEHDVRGLDFSFKPLRMIEVDVPNMAGRMRRTLVWYMVFHVKNPSADKPLLFTPQFWMEDLDKHTLYAEQLIPVAIPAIQRREDPNRPLLNTVQMTGEVAPG